MKIGIYGGTFNPIHLGVIMVCNLAVGMTTPPFGLNLFVTSPLSKVPPMTIGKTAFPYIGAFMIALVLITFIPAISLALVPGGI